MRRLDFPRELMKDGWIEYTLPVSSTIIDSDISNKTVQFECTRDDHLKVNSISGYS